MQNSVPREVNFGRGIYKKNIMLPEVRKNLGWEAHFADGLHAS